MSHQPLSDTVQERLDELSDDYLLMTRIYPKPPFTQHDLTEYLNWHLGGINNQPAPDNSSVFTILAVKKIKSLARQPYIQEIIPHFGIEVVQE